MTWKVVPLSPGQLLDCRPEDVLEGGAFRKCSTYRGGGGYDKFPEYCERFTGLRHSEQFVVQLYGCNLDCPYCYVTRAGVWGKPKEFTSRELADAFLRSGQETFHLMGGAPALQIRQWPELIDVLPVGTTFHSDLMLTERQYEPTILRRINQRNCVYAVGIKGLTYEEHLANTRKPFNKALFRTNLLSVVDWGLQVYFTFTNVDPDKASEFMEEFPGHDYFHIDLIDYDAQPYVDEVPWGVASKII